MGKWLGSFYSFCLTSCPQLEDRDGLWKVRGISATLASISANGNIWNDRTQWKRTVPKLQQTEEI